MTLFTLMVHLDSARSTLHAVAPLYIGPDQMLPLTSAVGAAIGVLLIVWQHVVALVRKGWRLLAKGLSGQRSRA
ncbi:MAG: hypothetical protein HY699_12755 [Deltaproteobacteria bacterium]|nr:hypothetical protein [Deltaproteobacteria bacterium]